MTKSVVLALAILIVSAPQAFSGGSIHGSVRHWETKELLGGTQLHFYKSGKDSVSRTITTSTGHFAILEVPVGEYSCRVYRSGFRPVFARQIHVVAGGTADVDIWLRPCRLPADSASLDLYEGSVETNNKIRIYTPPDKDYR